MTEAIIAAAVTGLLSLIGTVITVLAANSKTNETLKVSQAVTDTKIDELTREVREHNNFARRMPVVKEQIKVINNRKILSEVLQSPVNSIVSAVELNKDILPSHFPDHGR